MNKPDAATVVRTYFDAWTGKDFAGAGALLDDSLTVEGPLAGYENLGSFTPALADFGSLVSAAKLLAAMSDRDEAMLLYDLQVEGLGPLRVVEHFTVADGKITHIRQILDTVAVRAAGLDNPAGHMA
jgi:hypothetical protein